MRSSSAASRLEQALLRLEVDGMLDVRCGEAGDDGWLAENVGEDMAAPFSLCLERSIRITLLPALQGWEQGHGASRRDLGGAPRVSGCLAKADGGQGCPGWRASERSAATP
ncbi:hypothetical protein [Streptomyces sp. NPDC001948]